MQKDLEVSHLDLLFRWLRYFAAKEGIWQSEEDKPEI